MSAPVPRAKVGDVYCIELVRRPTATCEDCRLVLYERDDAGNAELAARQHVAATGHVTVVEQVTRTKYWLPDEAVTAP